ncbi:ABC transporter permease [Anaerococcus sp. ENR0831]|uniref:ABC transporter permease n=1 Tax=Anaerococcus martiniensis TaxID=3115615 RepID=A0ABW9M7Y3_9FIRM
MKKYLRKKIFTGILTILFAFVITFFLTRMSPGNPIVTMAGRDNPNPAQIDYLMEKYGLNESVPVQFLNYSKALVKGDFGKSIKSNQPVLTIIASRLGPTILLSLTATILSVLIGTILGLYAGRHNGSYMDKIFTGSSYIIDSVPVFWLALVLIVIFATRLGWLPTSGMYSTRHRYEGLKKFLDLLKHMVLPLLTIIIVRVPYYFRLAKSSVIASMNQAFIKTLRASGMDESKIFNKYVLRNALIPIITSFSMSLASVIEGVALIEIVFAWPGMGRVLMDAIQARDYPVISGLYLIISISVTIFMLLTDIIYVIVDPRMKLE